WREVANRRRVEYSNLPPGPLRFRVIAANNSGVWNEDGATVDLDVAPALYQTFWFRALAVGLFVAGLWALHRLRVRQLALRERRFRDAVETMPAMAFTAEPNGSGTFVNRRWVDYTGQEVEAAAGTGWHAVVHPVDLDRVLEHWQVALGTGSAIE